MKLIKEYPAPFGLIPAIRLTCVNRWGIVSMTKQQTVAEHVFGVMVIAEKLCEEVGLGEVETGRILKEALHHDDDEVYTSDIPTPAKYKEDRDKEKGRSSVIVKLADAMEALRFHRLYCNDTIEVKEWVDDGIHLEIVKLYSELDLNWGSIISIIGGKPWG